MVGERIRPLGAVTAWNAVAPVETLRFAKGEIGSGGCCCWNEKDASVDDREGDEDEVGKSEVRGTVVVVSPAEEGAEVVASASAKFEADDEVGVGSCTEIEIERECLLLARRACVACWPAADLGDALPGREIEARDEERRWAWPLLEGVLGRAVMMAPLGSVMELRLEALTGDEGTFALDDPDPAALPCLALYDFSWRHANVSLVVQCHVMAIPHLLLCSLKPVLAFLLCCCCGVHG